MVSSVFSEASMASLVQVLYAISLCINFKEGILSLQGRAIAPTGEGGMLSTTRSSFPCLKNVQQRIIMMAEGRKVDDTINTCSALIMAHVVIEVQILWRIGVIVNYVKNI